MPYPTKPKGGWQRPRQVVVNKSTVQIWEKKATQKVCEQIQGNFSEQYGRRPERSQGPFFYQEGGKTFASLPLGMIKDIQKSLLFGKMQKDCKAEGIELPKNIMAKDPIAHVLTPQEYLRNVEAGTMPLMNNHDMLKEMAEKVTANDQTKFVMMKFRDFKRPSPPTMPGPQNTSNSCSITN